MFSRNIGLFLRLKAVTSIVFFATFQIFPFPCSITSCLFAASSNGRIHGATSCGQGFCKFIADGLHCQYCTLCAKMLLQHYLRSVGLCHFLKELAFFENGNTCFTYLWHVARRKLLVIQI